MAQFPDQAKSIPTPAQLREDPLEVRHQLRPDVRRVGPAVDRAAAQEQPPVRRQPVVVEHVAHVLDADVGRQQRPPPLAERLGRDDLRRERHHPVLDLRHHVARDRRCRPGSAPPAAPRPAPSAPPAARAASSTPVTGLASWITPPRPSSAAACPERQVQRVQVPARPVEHPPGIGVARHVPPEPRPVEHLEVVDPVPPPERLLRLQLAHLLSR